MSAPTEFHAYEPEAPMLESVFTAYQQITGPTVGCLIEPDPLGPVNRIVTLVYGKRRIKSTLVGWHTLVGAEVKIRHESGHFRITEMFNMVSQQWEVRGGGTRPVELPPVRDPGWYVEVDGETVLYASDLEIHPLTPALTVPWRLRARKAAKARLKTWARATSDRIAARFGYVHESEVSDW